MSAGRVCDWLESGWDGSKNRWQAEQRLAAICRHATRQPSARHPWLFTLAMIAAVAGATWVLKWARKLVWSRDGASSDPARKESYRHFSHIALNAEAHSEWINMGLWDRPALHQDHKLAQPDRSFGTLSQHDHTRDWWNGFGPIALHQDAFLSSPNIHDFFPTRSFPRACQALASYLIHRASLHLPSNVKIYSDLQGSTANLNDLAILDVGHGCGDSLLLLARTLRPRRLHGVTSLPAHADRARSRLRTFYDARSRSLAQCDTLSTTTFEQTNEAGQVWCGDAIEFLDSYHRQDEELKWERYDLIYGLDCAYHFRTREKFLQLASQRLKPGGVLVLFDLVAAWPYPLDRSNQTIRSSSTISPQQSSNDFSIFHADHKTPIASPPTLSTRLLHRLTMRLSGVPSTNLKDVSQYLSDLKAAGLQPVEVQDVSSSVFPGFSTFLQGLGKGGENTVRDEWNADFIGLRGFGRIVNRWAKGGAEGAVRAVVTTAKKPRDAQ